MTDVIAGRFALCDPIARGGSGVVWRAYDRKIRQFCAAKVLRRRDAGDLLRFVREQSVRMSHEHVLTPYSWAAEDTHVVIASELVDGGSLSTLLGDYGPLAETTIATILDQLLQALDQVHAAGLVHRDVKPANLLLRATGAAPIQVLLSDFGLAIGAEDAHLTQVGTVVGTPGYLAPEILRGGVTPSPGHDLYAAGRVASALAVGAEPMQVGTPTDLSGLRPGPLRDLVGALGHLDARQRPPSARAAREWLRPLLVGGPPRTRDGEAVEVLHQLPPLPPDALAELGSPDTLPLETRPSSAPPTAALPTPALPTAALSTASPAGPPPDRADPRHRRRTPWIVATAVAAAVVGAGVPLGLALAGPSGSDAGAATTPTPSGPVTNGGSFVPRAVQAGQGCTFTDEGTTSAADGRTVVCRRRADGSYRWEPR